MKKKIVTGMLIALALCSITACGKNKASSSAAQSASVVGAEASKTAEGSAVASTTSQTPETSGSQTPETADSQVSQTPETAAGQTSAAAQGNETVSAAITLDEDMASVSYVLLARMISAHEGNTAFNAEDKTNGDTFWKEMNYLVSAYGINNKRISFDETTKQYTVKKAQLRFYAAALYSDLGKAKKLPEIVESNESVKKSGSKWQFAMNDTSAYDVAVQSCEKLDKSGSYKITVYLVDASARTSLGEYSAVIKKSPYKGKKSPFHYAVVSLEKMTKMPMETVLVGNTDSNTDTQDASGQGTATTDTTNTAASTTQTADSTDNATGSTSYGTVLSMPGASSGNSGTTGATSGTADGSGTQAAGTTDGTGSQAAETANSTASQSTAATDTAAASQSTAATDTAAASQTTGSDSDTISGASVTADAAKEIAQKYYGASSADGKEYTYKYEGTTTYQNVPYYNFSVSDGGTTVINILVSGDGARIYKGTNTNGSWSMQ